MHDVFHVSLLTPYRAPGDGRIEREVLPVIGTSEGDVEYEVEQILRHRKKRGRGRGLQYLVLWRGYDLSEAQWLDESELGHAQEILA